MRFFLLFFFSSFIYAETVVSTFWGDVEVQDETTLDLLKHPVLLRLKGIDQSGPVVFFEKTHPFSRYDHSLGVWFLVKKAKTSLREEIAGLLHDVSHTAFSHLADHLLSEPNSEHSYQDTIHLDFLQHYGIDKILPPEIKISDLNPDLPLYQALERPLPYLCADRIEYILHTAVVEKLISHEEAIAIISNLRFSNGEWFFSDLSFGEKMAELSCFLTQHQWGASWNFAYYEKFKDLLSYCFNEGIVSLEDFKYGDDQSILERILLAASSDENISLMWDELKNLDNTFITVSYDHAEAVMKTKPKCRAVDPWVNTENGLQKTSDLSPKIKEVIKKTAQWCQEGYGIIFL